MCVASQRHGVTAAIDDCRIKNAAVFDPEGITLRCPDLRSGRPVADVVQLILVDAVSTGRGGAGAAPRGERLPRSPKKGPTPITRALPGPLSNPDGAVPNLGFTIRGGAVSRFFN